MKRIVLLASFLWAFVFVSARQDTLKYRITLTDKAATAYSLERPSEFLSERAILRRQKQQLPLDSTDLPVCHDYIQAIARTGVKIVAKGKWENFVTVSCNDSTLIDKIIELPFVRSAEKVWHLSAAKLQKQKKPLRDTLINKPLELDSYYGSASRQIELNNGHKLHQAGFRGEGMMIAVVDAGFHNADKIRAMDNIRLAGIRDFVAPSGNLFVESDHGLKVFSCMAMNKPYVMIGTAPEASYWLLRSEDDFSEFPVEQDYWAAAIEFADSVGVDVVNTSLGYVRFDDTAMNYQYRNLDGRYSMMSRQASRMVDKGMVLVCSAGNEGNGTWKKITPPADAENILTVGAVDKNGLLASFSSVGHTADGRIKPDVMAMGLFAEVMDTDGATAVASGTSFATPILCGLVTCLWQARPELTARQLIELVRTSGDRMACPDNIYGYGIPDMWKAYHTSLKNKETTSECLK